MGLSKGSAPQLASPPSGVPPSCLPTSPFQGFVPFPLFPICDEPDSRQPSRALSPQPGSVTPPKAGCVSRLSAAVAAGLAGQGRSS